VIRVTLYSRKDCHLCSETLADLQTLQEEFPHQLDLIDVDASEALTGLYRLEIPVVEVGSFILKAPISRDELRRSLQAAIDQENPPDSKVNPVHYQTGPTWTRSDRFTLWFSRHYLAIFNLLVGLYVFLPFLAPVFMKAGAVRPAALIYRVYGMTCHQLAYRSFFLFGEQLVYPRLLAGVQDVLTFKQATGLSEGSDSSDIFAARQYIGNTAIGYKVALCERDIAIYGSILAFGLLYGLFRRKIPPLPWYLWFLFGILPVAIDGLSQLLSQLPFAFIPIRESTPDLRVITGALFGFTTAWFGYPLVEQAMQDTRQMLEDKRRRVQSADAAPARNPDLAK
jgi:uncharacterized membrane protein